MKKTVLYLPSVRLFKRGQIYEFKVSSKPDKSLIAGRYLENDIYIVDTSSNSVFLIFLTDNINDRYELGSKKIIEFDKSVSIFSENLIDEVSYYKLKKIENYNGLKVVGWLAILTLIIVVILKIKNKWALKIKRNKFKKELKNFNFDYVIKVQVEEVEFRDIQKHIRKMIYQKNWSPEKDSTLKKLEQRASDV